MRSFTTTLTALTVLATSAHAFVYTGTPLLSSNRLLTEPSSLTLVERARVIVGVGKDQTTGQPGVGSVSALLLLKRRRNPALTPCILSKQVRSFSVSYTITLTRLLQAKGGFTLQKRGWEGLEDRHFSESPLKDVRENEGV